MVKACVAAEIAEQLGAVLVEHRNVEDVLSGGDEVREVL